MITLKLLGRIELKDSSGGELHSLLRHTKHVALLTFLSLPEPGTWHRRDSLIATFWPELDQSRARGALRSALYTLRNHLPDDAIRARGDEDICVNADEIETDVAAMNGDFDAGRFSDALDRYKGELAPALYIDDSPGFEKWLDSERARAASIAKRCASALADQLEKKGALTAAIRAASRASEIDPDDEATARRWITLLDRSGDRSQAFAVYERFRNHIWDSFGVRPSAETVALLDQIRTRHEANPKAAAAAASETIPRHKERSVLWFSLITLLPLIALAFAYRVYESPAAAAASPVSVAILPMRNNTGDASLDYLSSGIADGIARRLARINGIEVRKTNSGVAVATSLARVNDSLEITATLDGHPLTSQRFTTGNIPDVETEIVTSIAGTVLRRPLPEIPRDLNPRIDPESYDLTLKGWYALLANAQTRGLPDHREFRAQEFFNRAIAIDSKNSRAISGLSSTWASLAITGEIPFKDGFEKGSAYAIRAIAIDSLEGSAWANLGILQAMRNHDLASGLARIDRGSKAEPSNAEIYLIRSVLLRTARRYDEAREAIRMAHALDPLSTTYVNQSATVEFCDDKPEAALQIFEGDRRSSPNSLVALNGSIRALAQSGRYTEAAALWRRVAELTGNSALVKELAGVNDANSYWNLRHRQGRKRLTALKNDASTSQVTLIRAYFGAGEPDSAYHLINAMPVADRPPLYRMSCFPDIDEYRSTPRFRETAARISWVGAR